MDDDAHRPDTPTEPEERTGQTHIKMRIKRESGELGEGMEGMGEYNDKTDQPKKPTERSKSAEKACGACTRNGWQSCYRTDRRRHTWECRCKGQA
jgi:hypothetical protein